MRHLNAAGRRWRNWGLMRVVELLRSSGAASSSIGPGVARMRAGRPQPALVAAVPAGRGGTKRGRAEVLLPRRRPRPVPSLRNATPRGCENAARTVRSLVRTMAIAGPGPAARGRDKDAVHLLFKLLEGPARARPARGGRQGAARRGPGARRNASARCCRRDLHFALDLKQVRAEVLAVEHEPVLAKRQHAARGPSSDPSAVRPSPPVATAAEGEPSWPPAPSMCPTSDHQRRQPVRARRICWQPFVDWAWGRPSISTRATGTTASAGDNVCDKPAAAQPHDERHLVPDLFGRRLPQRVPTTRTSCNGGCRFARNAIDELGRPAAATAPSPFSQWGPGVNDKDRALSGLLRPGREPARRHPGARGPAHADGRGHDRGQQRFELGLQRRLALAGVLVVLGSPSPAPARRRR